MTTFQIIFLVICFVFILISFVSLVYAIIEFNISRKKVLKVSVVSTCSYCGAELSKYGDSCSCCGARKPKLEVDEE